jgi:hypothetical protein
MKNVNDSVKYYGATVAFNFGLLMIGVAIAAVLYFGFTSLVQHTSDGAQIEFSEE